MNLELLDELVYDRRASWRPTSRRGARARGAPGVRSRPALDLKAVPGYGPDEQKRMVEYINRMALGVYGLPCPVVCAITGHAIAGGFVLARLRRSPRGLERRALRADRGQGRRALSAGRDRGRARRAHARGRPDPGLGNRLVDADECVRLGAFDEVVEPDEVVDRAVEVAASWPSCRRDVYARTKAELRATRLQPCAPRRRPTRCSRPGSDGRPAHLLRRRAGPRPE